MGGIDGEALEPLDDEAAALVRAYPMPEGTVDAVLNKAELAHALGVSEPTLAQWDREGLPAQERGTNGRPYQYRLSVAQAWVAQRNDRIAAERTSRQSAADQFRLALLGPDGLALPEDGISVKQQREIIDLERLQTIAARDRRQLIPRDDMVAFLEDLGNTLRNSFDAMPDRLAREAALDALQQEALQRALDDTLAALADRLEDMTRDEAPAVSGAAAAGLGDDARGDARSPAGLAAAVAGDGDGGGPAP